MADVNDVLTVNEQRAKLGLPPRADGDVLLLASKVVVYVSADPWRWCATTYPCWAGVRDMLSGWAQDRMGGSGSQYHVPLFVAETWGALLESSVDLTDRSQVWGNVVREMVFHQRSCLAAWRVGGGDGVLAIAMHLAYGDQDELE